MLLAVRVPEADVDEVSAILWGSDLVAVIVEEPRSPGLVDLRTGLIDGPVGDDGPVGERLAALVAELSTRWEVATIDDRAERSAVVDALRATAVVVRAGEHLVVVPPWLDHREVAADVVLAIDPGVAFGSGSHATTRLALAALERLVLTGSSVLDIGSGSGVLSVAAARLGARHVVAVDVDEEAVAVTATNAERNGVRPVLTIVAGGVDVVDPSSRFDVVVANLGAGALVELAPEVAMRLAPSGVAVLTGILDERVGDVVDAFAVLGVDVVDRRSVGGWSLAALARRPSR